MTRTKEEIAKRVKKNVPTLIETFPYATSIVFVGGFVAGVIVMWLFGG